MSPFYTRNLFFQQIFLEFRLSRIAKYSLLIHPMMNFPSFALRFTKVNCQVSKILVGVFDPFVALNCNL